VRHQIDLRPIRNSILIYRMMFVLFFHCYCAADLAQLIEYWEVNMPPFCRQRTVEAINVLTNASADILLLLLG
jgi:hypothetical protein